MQKVRSVLAALALGTGFLGNAEARVCRPCGFAGLCSVGEVRTRCVPSQAECIPNGGILAFNSVPANVPAYWALFARPRGRRSLRWLAGPLKVWADYSAGRPLAPGLPERCEAEDSICFGSEASFCGIVTGDRLTGVARYADGAACEFGVTLSFGFGGTEPNAFVCRDRSGEILSEGAVQLQLIRLRGCRRRRAP